MLLLAVVMQQRRSGHSFLGLVGHACNYSYWLWDPNACASCQHRHLSTDKEARVEAEWRTSLWDNFTTVSGLRSSG